MFNINQIIWIETQCRSFTILPNGYKLSVEWINEDKWAWFIQDEKERVVHTNLKSLLLTNRLVAKQAAFANYNNFIQNLNT